MFIAFAASEYSEKKKKTLAWGNINKTTLQLNPRKKIVSLNSYIFLFSLPCFHSQIAEALKKPQGENNVY